MKDIYVSKVSELITGTPTDEVYTAVLSKVEFVTTKMTNMEEAKSLYKSVVDSVALKLIEDKKEVTDLDSTFSLTYGILGIINFE